MKRFMTLLVLLSAPVFAGFTYTITDGMDFGFLTLTSNQSILVDGGGGYWLEMSVNSTALIKRTSPYISEGNGGIWQIRYGGTSKIAIEGGEIHRLILGSNTTAYISGGWIDEIWSYYSLPDPGHITLTCKPGYQITYTNNLATNISGNWQDGTAFSIKLVNPSGNSSVLSNMTIIPEPITLVLLGMGSLLFRRK